MISFCGRFSFDLNGEYCQIWLVVRGNHEIKKKKLYKKELRDFHKTSTLQQVFVSVCAGKDFISIDNWLFEGGAEVVEKACRPV